MNKRLQAGIVGLLVLLILGIFGLIRSNNPTKSKSSTTKLTYVAMGDSVAAGIGLDTAADSSACYRTKESYPYLLSTQRNYNIIDLSCSGASTKNGILGTQVVNSATLSSQMDRLFNLTRPDLITMTIGANDLDWISYLLKCYTANCGSVDDTVSVDSKIQLFAVNFKEILSTIQKHYNATPPTLIITGYYQVFPASNQCQEMAGITSSELVWTRLQIDKLNKTIKDTTSAFSYVKFVPLDFSSNELCASDSWVQGMTNKAPFHPTVNGHKAIAKTIELSL